MEERTRAYLRGRFGDHYRRLSGREGGSGGTDGVTAPPGANEREWGYIPWTRSGTTMVRHQGWLDLVGGGALSEFLARERPRHVYFSAGRYDRPGVDRMSRKGWRGSDLVFDLDADHLPGVDPETDSYAAMLADCKDALERLLDLLERDFGFEDLTVVFSGGRGYHVHVRDEGVHDLGRAERREVVEYVLGADLAFEDLVRTERVSGSAGRKTPAEKRTLSTAGGWSRRVHERVLGFVDGLLDLPEDEAIARLREFEGIGEGKATAALRAARENYDAIAAGNVDVHPAFYGVAERLFDEAVGNQRAPIDEPVTTDVNRLIRLPGSLHGGTGLTVRRIDRDALDDFDPLVDAVAATFVGNDITVVIESETSVELGGDRFTLPPGEHSVPEYAGVFCMARGDAEKGEE